MAAIRIHSYSYLYKTWAMPDVEQGHELAAVPHPPTKKRKRRRYS